MRVFVCFSYFFIFFYFPPIDLTGGQQPEALAGGSRGGAWPALQALGIVFSAHGA